MPQLTGDERESLRTHLQASSEQFQAAIARLTPEQWSFKPAAEVWSIAECADHVIATEKTLFQLVSEKLQQRAPDLERAAAVQGKERLIKRAVPDRSTRVKVPIQMDPTGHNGSPEELAAHFREVRQRTLDYVRDTQDPLHDRVSPHFVLKDLDGAQWLLMISLHTERHTAQIAEVKAAEGYP